MAQTLEQLAQLRPANTTAASLYQTPASTETLIKTIFVCNTSTAPAKCRIFHDDNGSTYDETTALFWDVEILQNQTLELDVNIMADDSTGNLAVRTDTASALTFTAYGSKIT